MGTLNLRSLDPVNEFDSLGNDQDEFDLMAAIAIMEERLGEGITRLC